MRLSNHFYFALKSYWHKNTVYLLGGIRYYYYIFFYFSGFVFGQWIETPVKYSCPRRQLYPCNCTSESDDGVQIKCNNTNIASLAVGLGQVRTLIYKLDISECNMEKLYGDIFKHKTIKILHIRDTPIKDISDNTFDGLADSLEELHLVNTWLTRVPPSIKNLTSLKVSKLFALVNLRIFSQ